MSKGCKGLQLSNNRFEFYIPLDRIPIDILAQYIRMLCPQMVFHWFSRCYFVGITDQAAINNSFVQIIMFIQALSCRICFVTLVTFKEKFQNFLGPREYPNHKNFWKFFLGRVETFNSLFWIRMWGSNKHWYWNVDWQFGFGHLYQKSFSERTLCICSWETKFFWILELHKVSLGEITSWWGPLKRALSQVSSNNLF